MREWNYSYAELAERIRKAFCNGGSFTAQDLNVIAPFYCFSMLRGLENRGIIRKTEQGNYILITGNPYAF